MEYMDMAENRYWCDVTGLTVWIVSLQLMLYVILRIKLKKAQ